MSVLRFCKTWVRDKLEKIGIAGPSLASSLRERSRLFAEQPDHWLCRLADRASARDWAQQQDSPVSELFYSLEKPEELPELGQLPWQCALRPSDGRGTCFLLHQGYHLVDGQPYTRQQIIDSWHTSWQRAAMPAASGSSNAIQKQRDCCWLVEELLFQEGTFEQLAETYRFHMVSGQVGLIELVRDPFTQATAPVEPYLLDANWAPFETALCGPQPQRPNTPMPTCSEDLAELARRLSRQVDGYLQIDLHATDRGPVFGSCTPLPASIERWTTAVDRHLGSLNQARRQAA